MRSVIKIEKWIGTTVNNSRLQVILRKIVTICFICKIETREVYIPSAKSLGIHDNIVAFFVETWIRNSTGFLSRFPRICMILKILKVSREYLTKVNENKQKLSPTKLSHMLQQLILLIKRSRPEIRNFTFSYNKNSNDDDIACSANNSKVN